MQWSKLMLAVSLLSPLPLQAEWNVITHTNIDNALQTRMAHTTNPTGQSMEIYQDNKGVVRLRFNMGQARQRLAADSCPTYQIDNLKSHNRSIHDAQCLSNEKFAEFILGYIIDNQINSDYLHEIIQGKIIKYRYRLKNTGYAESEFSLSGSNNMINKILAPVVIKPSL